MGHFERGTGGNWGKRLSERERGRGKRGEGVISKRRRRRKRRSWTRWSEQRGPWG